MEIYVKRTAKRPDYTIGRLFINTKKGYPLCNTLEPTWRDYAHGEKKIKGCSAIPEGRYEVVVTYSPKKKKTLPLLLGVPMFQGIRIPRHPHSFRKYLKRHGRLYPCWREPCKRNGFGIPLLDGSADA